MKNVSNIIGVTVLKLTKVTLRPPNPYKFGKRCVFNFEKICWYSHVTLANDDDKKMKALEKEVASLMILATKWKMSVSLCRTILIY